MKEKKGEKEKEKKKTNEVQNPTTLDCSALSVESVRLLQNRTSRLTELIISSCGQYIQIQPPAKVLRHLPYIQEQQQRHIT